MRLTVVLGLAATLAVACMSLIVHQRATAAADQQLVAEAEAAQGNKFNDRAAVTPSTGNPGATDATAILPAPNLGNKSGWGSYSALYNPYQRDYAFPVADPETAKLTAQDQQLEQESQSLQRQLADTDDEAQRTELKGKLRTVLDQQFDAQQKLRELEVAKIEARLQKLRGLIGRRADSRGKIIDNRLEQLLNDAAGLGWSSAAKDNTPYAPPGVPVMLYPGGGALRGPAAPRSVRP